MGIKTGNPRGRPPGTRNKATAKRQQLVATTGITPLDFMLERLRAPDASIEERMDAAKAAAPYIHPRLALVQSQSTVEHRFVIELPALPESSDQWQQQFKPITKLPGAPNGHNSH